MDQRSRCHQTVNDRHGVWGIKTSPRLSYSFGDRDKAITVTPDKLTEPALEDLSLVRIPEGQPLDALPDLAYD
jgi:hypothetical protein